MYRNESPIPKGAIIGCEEKRENDITASLHELEKSISILQDEMNVLYGKLHPVMRNEPSSNESCAPEILNRCDLSAAIRSHSLRIESVTRDVRVVIGLLEI